MRQTRKDPDSPLAPKAAWSRPLAAFVGRVHSDESFAFDGRVEDDFAPVWEADLAARAYWTSPAGYEIRPVSDPDFSPDTMVLLAPGGERCGFCSGPQVWVDPDHRGQALGSELVLALTGAIGRGPASEHGGLGFSEAGLRTHRRAWCMAVERALDAGLRVDAWIATAAQVYRDGDPLPGVAPGMG